VCARAVVPVSSTAQEVKDAEAAAEVLMQRLATAQGKTISTQQRLADEKARLEKAKQELADVEAQEKKLKRSEKTDKLVQALEKGDDAVGAPCAMPRPAIAPSS
jgi:TolA-binding protein